jgi:hypothetical protein
VEEGGATGPGLMTLIEEHIMTSGDIVLQDLQKMEADR